MSARETFGIPFNVSKQKFTSNQGKQLHNNAYEFLKYRKFCTCFVGKLPFADIVNNVIGFLSTQFTLLTKTESFIG